MVDVLHDDGRVVIYAVSGEAPLDADARRLRTTAAPVAAFVTRDNLGVSHSALAVLGVRASRRPTPFSPFPFSISGPHLRTPLTGPPRNSFTFMRHIFIGLQILWRDSGDVRCCRHAKATPEGQIYQLIERHVRVVVRIR